MPFNIFCYYIKFNTFSFILIQAKKVKFNIFNFLYFIES